MGQICVSMQNLTYTDIQNIDEYNVEMTFSVQYIAVALYEQGPTFLSLTLYVQESDDSNSTIYTQSVPFPNPEDNPINTITTNVITMPIASFLSTAKAQLVLQTTDGAYFFGMNLLSSLVFQEAAYESMSMTASLLSARRNRSSLTKSRALLKKQGEATN